MEMIMKKETKETTPKERIVVLEKGKNMDVGPLAACCFTTFMPYRGW
jgi:hypothetical protein